MVFRPSYWLAAVSLALVPWVRGGEKIEFSAPSSAWAVPQPDLPDNDSRSDSDALHLSRPSTAMADPLMGVPTETIYIIRRPRHSDRLSDNSLDKPFDPLATSADERTELTNSWQMPRAWDNDQTAFSKERYPDAFAHQDPFNPFGKTSSSAREGGLLGSFLHNDSSNPADSQWRDGAHDPLTLERIRNGEFVPYGNDATASAPDSADRSSLARRAFGESGTTPAYEGITDPYSLSSTQAPQAPTAPSLMGFGQDNTPAQRNGYSPNGAPAQTYFGGRGQEMPPAVLKWPRPPGDLFQ